MADKATAPSEPGAIDLQCGTCRRHVKTLRPAPTLVAIQLGKPILPVVCSTCGVRFSDVSLNELRLLIVRQFVSRGGTDYRQHHFLEAHPEAEMPKNLKRLMSRYR